MQGDIAVMLGRNAIKCPDNLCFWPKDNGSVRVPYLISSDYTPSEMDVILQAMKEFSTLTCVKFVNRTLQTDYLYFTPVDGCWSYLGRTGGQQIVSLNKDGCLISGVIQHEVNHALGFQHEQCRSDRDQYIKIHWENLDSANQYNFMKMDTNNLGIPYDYSSVMHYGRYAFTNATGKATIELLKDTNALIGQRYGISPTDVLRINRLYSCDVCSSLFTEEEGTVTSANTSQYNHHSNCVFLIRVPARKVLLNFETFDIRRSAGCGSDYIKIYDGDSKDSPVLVNKTCGTDHIPALFSSSNKMLIEFASDGTTSTFRAKYKTVACGVTITAMKGEFTSLNYPGIYPNNYDCTWVLSAPKGYKISVMVPSFHLENSPACVYDYMTIQEVTQSDPIVTRKLCGDAPVPAFVSSGNMVEIYIHTDRSVQSSGVRVQYEFVPLQA